MRSSKISWFYAIGFGLWLFPIIGMAQSDWTDVTTDRRGNPSTCEQDSARCSFKNHSVVFTKPLKKLNFAKAMAFCEKLSYNGTSKWRLPNYFDIKMIRSTDGLSWSESDTKKSFWLDTWLKVPYSDLDYCRGTSTAFNGTECLDTEKKADVVCVQVYLDDYWEDATIGTNGKPSSCKDDPNNCTYKLSSGLLVSRLIDRKDWYTANGNSSRGCGGLKHNHSDGWRLPETSELADIVDFEAYRLPNSGILASDELWSAQTDEYRSEEATTYTVLNPGHGMSSGTKRKDTYGYVCVK